MASVIRKIIKGNAYYYLIENAWVNGKSKRVWQKYLGTAENIKKVYERGGNPIIYSKVFGSVASMLSMAQELGLKEIISNAVPDMNYKLKVWEHILMQSICRFNGPASKKKSIKWYDESILSLIWGRTFTSPQTIMNQFDKLVKKDANMIPKIEEGLCKALISKGITPSIFIWDPTNFFTHISKGEELPRKGASKEKRYDKNIINLGMVVSDENIPILHTVYEGNKHETKVITEVVDTLYSRFTELGFATEHLVIVFDRGNNSEDNIGHIDEKFSFVGALKKTQVKHLFEINLDKFEKLYETESGNIISGYRTTETIYGKPYTVVVTYNERTAAKQREKTHTAIGKITEKFNALEKSVNMRKIGRKPTTKGIAMQVSAFFFSQYRSLFAWNFDEATQQFSWSRKEGAILDREKTYGKNVLFTDMEEWGTEKIARIYNSKIIVEDDFRVLKDRLLISVKPFYHRKDTRLRAHIFICILSMLLYRYMLWKLKLLNFSETQIVEGLKEMRVAFIKEDGSNAAKKVMERMTPVQMSLYAALNLGKYMEIKTAN